MNSDIRYGVIFLVDSVPHFYMYDGNSIYNGIETVLENEYYDNLMPNEVILIVSTSEVSFNDSETNDMIFGIDENTDEYFDEILITYAPVVKRRLKTDLEIVDLVDMQIIRYLIDEMIETYNLELRNKI